MNELGEAARDKQTKSLGEKFDFRGLFDALFMASGPSSRRKYSPLHSRRVLSRNQAKSEIYDLQVLSRDSWRREMIFQRSRLLLKPALFRVITRGMRIAPTDYFVRILVLVRIYICVHTYVYMRMCERARCFYSAVGMFLVKITSRRTPDPLAHCFSFRRNRYRDLKCSHYLVPIILHRDICRCSKYCTR